MEPKKVTVSVHRRPKRSFINPRRVTDVDLDAGNGTGSRLGAATASTRGGYVKKQNLSPLFRRILKKLVEKDQQNQGEERSKEEGDVTGMGVYGDCDSDRPVTHSPGEEEMAPSSLRMGNQASPNEEYGYEMDQTGTGGSEEGQEFKDVEDEVIVLPELPVPATKKRSGSSGGNNQFSKPGIFSQPQKRPRLQEGIEHLSSHSSDVSHWQPHPTQTQDGDDKIYYEAVYANASTRKHKKMESDGFIVVSKGSKGTNIVLKDPSGKTIESSNSCKLDSEHFKDGKIFQLGGKEVQISEKLHNNPFAVMEPKQRPRPQEKDIEDLSGHSSYVSHVSHWQPNPTQTQDGEDKIYYEAVYANASTRKHKKMESDGFIVVSKGSKGTNIVLKDPSGKTIESSNSCKLDSEHFEDGKIFQLGGKEVQISEKLQSNPFVVMEPKQRPRPQEEDNEYLSSHSSVVSHWQPHPTQTQDGDDKIYYEAVYANASTRKHKKMESDGFIVVSKGSKGTNIVLKDTSGKTIESSNSCKLDSDHFEDGKIFQLGGKEVQISEKLQSNPFAVLDVEGDIDRPVAYSPGEEEARPALRRSNQMSFGEKDGYEMDQTKGSEEGQEFNNVEDEVFGLPQSPVTATKKGIRCFGSSNQFSNPETSSQPQEPPQEEDIEYLSSHSSVVSHWQPHPTQTQDGDDKIYYEAVYAKASTRKHKKMESDGFIVVSKGTKIVLKDASGKTIENSNSFKLDSEHFEDGKIFKLGGKEVQISEKLQSIPFW